MITLTLYHNTTEEIRLDKTSYLTGSLELTGLLKEGTSITSPSILIERANEDLFTYNYVYIEEFNRYYFIDSITSENNHLWRINCSVDVLMSFKENILDIKALISRNETIFDVNVEDDKINFSYDKDVEYFYLVRDENYEYTPMSFSFYDLDSRNIVISHYIKPSNITVPILTKYPYEWLFLPENRNFPSKGLFTSVSSKQIGYSRSNLCCSVISSYDSLLSLTGFIARESSKYDYIGSITAYPFTPKIVGTDTQYLYINDTPVINVTIGDTAGSCYVYPTISNDFKILGVYEYEDINSFLDYEPYTNYDLFVPFVGYISILADDLKNKKISIAYSINYYDGSSHYYVTSTDIHGKSYYLSEGECQVGINIPLTTTNQEEIRNQIASYILNASVGAMGSYFGVSRGQMALAKANRMRNTRGSNTPTLKKQRAIDKANLDIGESYYEGASNITEFSNFNSLVSQGNTNPATGMLAAFTTLRPHLKITRVKPLNYNNDFNKIFGRPLNDFYKLENLVSTGYTQCGDFHLENFGNATYSEISSIDSLLRSGIIL